jgi:filamentous hemagglutinin family protein
MNRSQLMVGFGLLVAIAYPQGAHAQVTSDGSLTTPTLVPLSVNGKDFLINAGTRSGNNLFHSFSQFSVPSNGSAIFNNATNIQNIFSRVTGSQLSNINGILKTQGSANLFLMNPNGIVFGPNAQLQLGGSFLGTTASAIKFDNGIQFNTLNATPALLSVNLPIGLQMGTNPGVIQVQGTGNLLKTQSTLLAPYFPIGASPSLQVAPLNTLALVGGHIAIDGGVLTAPSGRIELASIGSNGSIPLVQQTPNLLLGTIVGDRGDIQLSNKALIDVNGIDSGSIQLQGRQVNLTSGAILWSQNRGANTGGTITVNATDRIFADGTAADLVAITPNGPVFSTVSGIINETVGADGGKISLSAPIVTVQNGASVMSRSFTPGTGGEILINAKTLTVKGASPILGNIFSILGSSTAGKGQGGKITLQVQDLAILDGGALAALTIGNGDSGNVAVTADTVRISGLSPILLASALSVPTLGGSGHSGNLLMNTRTLEISDGAFISSSSLGPGDAGNIMINASESVEIRGLTKQKGNYQTGLSSAVSPPLEPYKSLFNLADDNATGASGSVTVNTPSLRIVDRGYIVVENTGSGTAGILEVNADRIELTRAGFLSAGSRSGQGGNIKLTTDTIILRDTGKIYTASLGSGNGGNINIITNSIVGINNSDIIASAISGRGGKISITTSGIFGLQYRDRLTDENDITASSQFGISGTVQVNTIGINPANALNTLPVDVVDSSRQISNRCASAQNGSFVSTGRGGIPQKPIQTWRTDRPWTDLRSPGLQASAIVQPIAQNTNPSLIEASAFQVDASGAILLVATTSIASQTGATCGIGESH